MELRYCEKCGDIIKLEGTKDERINPAEHFVCPRCEGSTEGPLSAKDSFEGILDQSTLNLFSPSTLAMKRSELIKEAPKAAEGPVDPTKPLTVRAGSSFPARTARKLQFRCLHCRSTLMIRPVEKPSRMVCPKCKGNLFIDQTGIVSKRGAGSEPEVTNAAPPRPSSARLPTGQPAPRAETAAAPPRAAAPPPAPPRTALVPPAAPKIAPPPPATPRPAHPPAAPVPQSKSGPGSTKLLKTTPEPKSGAVRRMPSSIQRTFNPNAGPAPAEPEPKKTSLIRTPDDPFAGAVLESPPAVPRQAKSALKPRKEPSGLAEPERGRHQEDLFRGLSISGKSARTSESAGRKSADSASGEGAIKDFEELEAELAQVEDFTKPLPEYSHAPHKISTPARRTYHSAPQPVGLLRRVSALILASVLAFLAAAPFYLAGHLSAEAGGPSDSPLAGGSQRPAFERLGKLVEKGRAAILSLPDRGAARAQKAAPLPTGEGAGSSEGAGQESPPSENR